MTKKILIASHGHLASGFKSSIKILTGLEDQVQVIDAYVTDEDYSSQIDQFLADIEAEDQGIIFTDIFGGSVNQRIVSKCLHSDKAKQVYVISNANLGVILSVLLSPEDLSEASLQSEIEESAVKLVQLEAEESDDDFFA
ncbi:MULTISPECIES: PTS sugar transporter subunit IIA [Aerococcus]|uniref:PTS mannose transporter subunit IIA n=1 Tax=Aerococcus tenax TaxID=3078812 RepID=A0A5N1BM18_9LACT|nr:PTS mannose transporter subunit IIA [Aerococcus urinae]KAA9241135.1 PTS mannose transporter subunit IIA [Aerococcus urinae]MDK6597765.1 PTS fructose transporter subunit IIA [Aerococcus urinae]MDK7302655.1 PTS fructose transporter subunit IIA [Aerococcus urinae]MDK7801561.1 PTS fructose transporter subunit IIA [Aerococcus urinae]MDK8654899.1 PTS fructose transporter subunit IIA [Aerococcus urinae]